MTSPLSSPRGALPGQGTVDRRPDVHLHVSLNEPGSGARPPRAKLVRRDAALFDRKKVIVPRLPIGAVPVEVDEPAPATPVAAAAEEVAAGRPVDTFGMDAQNLRAQRDELDPTFLRHYDRAKQRQIDKARNKRYEQKQKTFVDNQGKPREGVELVRTKKTRAQRFTDKNTERGKNFQAGVKRVAQRARELVNSPRKTGSNYLGPEATGSLLSGATKLSMDYSLDVQATAKLGNGVVGLAGRDDPCVTEVTKPINDVLTFVAPALAAGDAALSIDNYGKLTSERHKAQADLLHYADDARRFLLHLEKATPEEAEAYLRFKAAAEKLFDPTQEELSTLAAAKANAAKLVVVQSMSSTAGAVLAGVELAGAAVPGSQLATAPLAAASGIIDVGEGRQEYLRRLDQEKRAGHRKAAMEAVLADYPDDALLEGLVKSLCGYQDLSIDQAQSEQRFGLFRAGKGGAVVGATAGVLVAGGLTAAGVLSVPTFGASLAVAAVPAVAWGVAGAVRDVRRKEAEHDAKWRQRAVRALAFEMSRDELEEALEKDSLLSVKIQEGDYLSKTQGFAGSHEEKFKARGNEYLGLHVLALQVQDMVRSGNYKADSPYMRLLHAAGIGPVQLLAICKVAKSTPAHAQLDYIQSQLALAEGIKLLMTGAIQPLPHVGMFLDHFSEAMDTVADRGFTFVEPDAAQAFAEIRKELRKRPNPEVYLPAFDSAIGTFLKKIEAAREPETPFIVRLKGFATYSAQAREDEPPAPAASRPGAVERVEEVYRPIELPEPSPARAGPNDIDPHIGGMQSEGEVDALLAELLVGALKRQGLATSRIATGR